VVASKIAGLSCTLLLVAGCRATPGEPTLSADSIAQHTRILASDEYLGRGPGQKGGELAADYIADRFRAYGLEAPKGSYFQAVPMVGNTPEAASAELSFRGRRGSLAPKYLDDFVLNPGNAEASSAMGEAELVFVGYGIDAPEYDWNDYSETDVAGKFILMLVNDPPAPASEPGLFGGVAMTYYGRWTYKYEEAARRGALGALIVHETGPAGYPWSVVRGGFSGEQFSLPLNPSAPPPAGMIGWVSLDVARAALRAGGLDFDDLRAKAGVRGFRPVDTGVMVRGGVQSAVRRIDTKNVVGLLPGSERPDEYVLVTAHYDHFGVGEPVEGDSIYNGAYDDASGAALLIDMARAMSALRPAPRRSVLFMSTAAEEQGLLGAEHYVQSPLFPLDHTVAEINFDEANVWGETSDVQVLGVDRNGLGDYARQRAEEMGLTLAPEAQPEVGTYFRSDHFPFAKAGVPALYMQQGWHFLSRPAGWGDSVRTDYIANRYHTPFDEIRPDFVFAGAVQQGNLGMLTLLDVANADTWPNWNEGQEFKAARDAMMGGR
jgi:Zn-dependent M28 family amino/carboxypeptidase